MEKNKTAEVVFDDFWLDNYELEWYDKRDIVNAMKEYAKLKIEEQILICADEATTETNIDYLDYNNSRETVDRDSIRNCTRVKLD